MVLDTLQLDGLKLECVYSITTDGGSNLLKCVKLLIYHREKEAENQMESANVSWKNCKLTCQSKMVSMWITIVMRILINVALKITTKSRDVRKGRKAI